MRAEISTEEVIQGLRGVRDRVRSTPDQDISGPLASAFGWDQEELRPREISVGHTRVGITRSFFGVQPATVFASAVHRNGYDPLDSAALYAYHAAVRWGVFASVEGLTVFNSHCVSDNNWLKLPHISWDNLPQYREVIGALRPKQLAEGDIDRIALNRPNNYKILQSVDDELVNRLDKWRDEAMKYSRNEHRLDEKLQRLFAQLFVLRTVEDRNLAAGLASLLSVTRSSEELDRLALSNLFDDAGRIVGSELFEDRPGSDLPAHIVAGVIHDLYKPHGIPGREVRYNFSWIDSDVLGLAYEKYLSTVLHPAAPAMQMELFRQPERGVERITVRKAGGVYYTPPFITRFLAKKCVDDFYIDGDLSKFPKIIDFACGSGSFLVAAVDALLQRLKAVDPDRNWAHEIVNGGYINGVDIDERAVTAARLNLWQRLSEEDDPLPLPNLSRAIVQGDGLDKATWGFNQDNYNIVLGNPPFLATGRVPSREFLEAQFQTARGRYDFSSLFVEQAIRISAPSAIIGMVIPNRLFINKHAGQIRGFITRYTNLETVVDFGSNEVFHKTAAYVGCIIARVITDGEPLASHVRVVDVQSIPAQFAAAMLLDAEELSEDKYTDVLRVFLAQHPRGEASWNLLSAAEKKAQVLLEDASEPLSSIAGVYQGIRTGANDIFIVDIISQDDAFFAEIKNGLGDTAIIEADLLRPVTFGSEVKRYDLIFTKKALIYPYKNGTVISEGELEARYPQAHKYFVTYRDILSSRNSISSSGQRWYEIVRRRDEEWMSKPKLLIRDLATETAFAVDRFGGVFSVGGTAVVPADEDLLLPLLAYLNSKPISELVKRTTPSFRGSFQKFEPQHIMRIPVMHRLLVDDNFSEHLALLAEQITAARAADRLTEADYIAEKIDEVVQKAMDDQSHSAQL